MCDYVVKREGNINDHISEIKFLFFININKKQQFCACLEN